MIYLASNRTNIPVIAEQWKNKLYGFMFEKGKQTKTYYEKINARIEKAHVKVEDRIIIEEIIKDYQSRFDFYVLADNKEMISLMKEYNHKMKHASEDTKTLIKNIFVKLYKDFSQHKTFDGITTSHYFLRKLDIRTCPYCNRQYTFTIDKETIKTAPEYDHFYSKVYYPILSVSFYNLIPSCHTCNHIKGTKTAYVNPYFRGFESSFRLVNEKGIELDKAEILKQGGGKVTFLKSNGKVSYHDQRNIETFGLQELYSKHDDYIKDLIEKVMAYNSTAQQALVDAFQSAAYSPQQVFDFVWGKYLEVSLHENQPFSKLTKDILEQLGIQR